MMMHTRLGLIRKLFAQGTPFSSIATQLQLQAALRGCETVLDVGCGNSSPLRALQFGELVGIDGYPPAVKQAMASKAYKTVLLGDVRELTRHFEPKQFDACVAIDVIEHLTKDDGKKLMNAMEQIAKSVSVLLTPNGFLSQHHAEEKDLQEHISGWDAKEMEGYGYTVTGVLGPRCLRGEYHRLKHGPKPFWGAISLVGDLIYTRHVPEKAAAILCVKRL